MEKLTEIGTAVIAFLTFMGVGVALANYFSEIRKVPDNFLSIIIIFYILVTLLFTVWIRRISKWNTF